MKDSEYLTLEESAQKLDSPVSWVKESVCRGKLGGKLEGRRWLVSVRDLDRLLAERSSQPSEVVHDFLPEPAKKNVRSSRLR
jgi:hypothetical protein